MVDLLEDLDREGIQGQKRQEIYKRFLTLRARMVGQPYSGGFELTPLCNFDCKMCYVHLSQEQMKGAKVLTTEQWIDIIGQAIDAGLMHADLTGGECLKHPGFKEIYLYLRSRGVEVSVLTNGQLITDDIADFFAEYPPAIVQITVYGSDEDKYEAVTGRRAFGDVKNAIERLKARGIRMLLTVTPSQYMQEDTHALLEFLRSMNVRYGIGTGSLPARPDTGRVREDYMPGDELYTKLHLDEQEFRKANNAQSTEFVPSVVFERIPTGFKMKNNVPCSSGVCTFHVNWKGELQPCIPFYTVRKSIIDDGFAVAWEWIKARMDTYKPPVECAKCDKASACEMCPAERTLGILNGPLNKDLCHRTESYIKAGVVKVMNQDRRNEG